MLTKLDEKIVILGISDKPDRYSFKAYKKLLENGFTNQIGVSPKTIELPKIQLVDSLKKLPEGVHTLTLYVGAERLESMIEDILAVAPERIITNPGTENKNLIAQARKQGVEVIEGCTLIMLDTEQF